MAFNITAISVCVNYSDLLARSLHLWKRASKVIIVTSTTDKATQDLCKKQDVECYMTDVFYENNARFNKFAALSELVEVYELRRGDNWLLTFDSDILPPNNWRQQVESGNPQIGFLYGAYRHQVAENATSWYALPHNRMPQGWVIGFFMLFHPQDPAIKDLKYIFDIDFPHAGNVDTIFCRRWPTGHAICLPIETIHFGNERENWTGRGNYAELQSILQKRIGIEGWERERMNNPPQLKTTPKRAI